MYHDRSTRARQPPDIMPLLPILILLIVAGLAFAICVVVLFL